MRWKDVYKDMKYRDKKILGIYIYPRDKKMTFLRWIRLKIAEWAITPYLMTKDEKIKLFKE